MKKSCKRGQIQLSFGVIFSIILVVVFLAFAFYAIKTFIGFENSANAGKFFDALQSDIDRVWQSSSSSQIENYAMPSYADYICLADFSSGARGANSVFFSDLKRTYTGTQNAAFYPVNFNGFESKELNHIDLGSITSLENPFCMKAGNGKVSLVLKKDFGEALVKIERT